MRMGPVQSRVDENSCRTKNAGRTRTLPQQRTMCRRMPSNQGRNRPDKTRARIDYAYAMDEWDQLCSHVQDTWGCCRFRILHDKSSTQTPDPVPFRLWMFGRNKDPATDFFPYLMMRESRCEERVIVAMLPYFW